MNRKILFVCLIISVMSLSSLSDTSATPIHPDRIAQVAHLEGGFDNRAFGSSVAISGNTIAVGDAYASQDGVEVGAVTIFQPDQEETWVEIAYITPTIAEEGMQFGRNITLQGDRLVVGAPGNLDLNTQPGSVYIYERNQGGTNAWGQVARLIASDARPSDNYGWAVSISGDTLVVGAYTRPIGGRVYIYERDAGGMGSWGETAQLSPDDPGFGAGFGVSVDLDGDLLAVGAYAGGDYAGYVYIFQRMPDTNQWQRLTRFRAADTYAYHFFGYTLALDDWTALVGAPGADGLTGAAYIFTADATQPDTWTEQARLTPSDGAMNDYFSLGVDLAGNNAWVGSPGHANSSGAAYLYTQNTPGAWQEVATITGEDTVEGDGFATWCAIDGSYALAGAPGSLPNGSAYVFDLHQPWRNYFPLILH